MENKRRVLEIGPGADPKAHKIWEDAIVETVEANEKFDTTYHWDARNPPEELYEQYDVVMASHVLEHIAYHEVHKTLTNWVKLLKPGGQMHLIVPSGEWSAIQLLSFHPSRAMQMQLHGAMSSPWDVHLTTFTMPFLRALCEMCGLAISDAKTSGYQIQIKDELYPAEQHYVKGFKIGTSG